MQKLNTKTIMAKRIIVKPDFECGCEPMGGDSQRGRGRKIIYTEEDFKLSYTFSDNRFRPKVVIPPKNINCVFKYVVLGGDKEYVASSIDGVLTNCYIDEASNTLKVMFKNHGLPPGKLMVSYNFLIKDVEFPGETARLHKSEDTGITLTDNEWKDVNL